MECFSAAVKFKHPWRNYQQRLLDELQNHMEDDHLHVVAPPGSGKTVLGLEVMRRLNRPALICAPSRALRDQWVDRFCSLFLNADSPPDWISDDIRTPGRVTVVTYQALHSAMASGDEQVIIGALNAAGVKVFVLDEAHHLKNAWWQALMQVKNALNPRVVGLTATPPYDVSSIEWQRYVQLNGDIDSEIAVPELVRAGDLAPHQDYIFLSEPTEREAELLNRADEHRRKLADKLLVDQEIMQWLGAQPCMVDPKQSLDWIYENLSTYIAAQCFWRAAGHALHPMVEEILAVENFTLPAFAPAHLAQVLKWLLAEKSVEWSELQERVTHQLQRAGLFHRGRVDIEDSERRHKLLLNSAGKLRAIVDIFRAEWADLQQGLRQVILADHIRLEYMGKGDHPVQLNKLGVIPVFEALRTQPGLEASGCRLAVLTGQEVIIPNALGEALQAMVQAETGTRLVTEVLVCADNYSRLLLRGQDQQRIVTWLTRLFCAGDIHILVGTAALLGEGWDAPAINSLIIASAVGSYVQSNQMRGRAIRVDPMQPDKVANIWHLACVRTGKREQGNEDLLMLERRFQSFVGVSQGSNGRDSQSVICNGIERLNMPDHFVDLDTLVAHNQDTLIQASNRFQVARGWAYAVEQGSQMRKGMQIPFGAERPLQVLQRFRLARSLQHLLALVLFWSSLYFQALPWAFAQVSHRIQDWAMLMKMLGIGIGLASLFSAVKFFQYIRLWLRYRDIGKDLRKIADALLLAMHERRLLTSPFSLFHITHITDASGEVTLDIAGGSVSERRQFVTLLAQLVAPVDNPRYILTRESVLKQVLTQRDYHAVPDPLGTRKQDAESLQKHWQAIVGPCELIYTRTLEGRQLLHKARLHNLSAEVDSAIKKMERWGF